MRHYLKAKILFPALLIVSLIAGAQIFFSTISVKDGWHYEVFREDLEEVSGLVLDREGILYISLEGRAGKGQLLSLNKGNLSLLLDSLNKPDGLAIFNNNPVFTQEDRIRPVIEYRNGESITLFSADTAEGIAVAKNGDVFVLEDRNGGHLLKYDRQLGSVTSIVSDLVEAEGICLMDDGTIYYSENGQGLVYRLRSGTREVFLDQLSNPGFLKCESEAQGIWITEDRTNFGRLLRVTNQGQKIEVISERLKSPQSIAFTREGDILLAEQGRDRVLLLIQDRGQ